MTRLDIITKALYFTLYTPIDDILPKKVVEETIISEVADDIEQKILLNNVILSGALTFKEEKSFNVKLIDEKPVKEVLSKEFRMKLNRYSVFKLISGF